MGALYFSAARIVWAEHFRRCRGEQFCPAAFSDRERLEAIRAELPPVLRVAVDKLEADLRKLEATPEAVAAP